MGMVWKAYDTTLHRKVAIKILSAVLASRREFRARFVREARMVAALSHPNVCVIHEVGETDLQQLFSGAGTVESVTVMRDMATGRARGFGFVEMGSDAEALKAIDQFNGQPFGGRNLTVNEARPKPERSGGGGGFGGGRGAGRGGRRSEPRW